MPYIIAYFYFCQDTVIRQQRRLERSCRELTERYAREFPGRILGRLFCTTSLQLWMAVENWTQMVTYRYPPSDIFGIYSQLSFSLGGVKTLPSPPVFSGVGGRVPSQTSAVKNCATSRFEKKKISVNSLRWYPSLSPPPNLSPIFLPIIESYYLIRHANPTRSCYAGEIVAWPDQPDEIPEMHFPSSDEGAGQSWQPKKGCQRFWDLVQILLFLWRKY